MKAYWQNDHFLPYSWWYKLCLLKLFREWIYWTTLCSRYPPVPNVFCMHTQGCKGSYSFEILNRHVLAHCNSYNCIRNVPRRTTLGSGRDGLEATATLYYDIRDCGSPNMEQSMKDYCKNTQKCRKQFCLRILMLVAIRLCILKFLAVNVVTYVRFVHSCSYFDTDWNWRVTYINL